VKVLGNILPLAENYLCICSFTSTTGTLMVVLL